MATKRKAGEIPGKPKKRRTRPSTAKITAPRKLHDLKRRTEIMRMRRYGYALEDIAEYLREHDDEEIRCTITKQRVHQIIKEEVERDAEEIAEDVKIIRKIQGQRYEELLNAVYQEAIGADGSPPNLLKLDRAMKLVSQIADFYGASAPMRIESTGQTTISGEVKVDVTAKIAIERRQEIKDRIAKIAESVQRKKALAPDPEADPPAES